MEADGGGGVMEADGGGGVMEADGGGGVMEADGGGGVTEADGGGGVTEADGGGGVISLTHCQQQIFCLSLPERCPSCGEPLRGGRLLEAPVRLPPPFSNAHHSPCCLLVATAAPHLLSDFEGESELHTGISSTTGVVYNYTGSGVRRDLIGWERSVCVPLVRPDMFHLLAQWDQYLDRFSQSPMWDPAWHRFDEVDHNCFSFCLHFLNGVLAAEGRGSMSRDDFTRTFILPRMRRVSKYTSLYRHLLKHKVYLVDRPDPPADP